MERRRRPDAPAAAYLRAIQRRCKEIMEAVGEQDCATHALRYE